MFKPDPDFERELAEQREVMEALAERAEVARQIAIRMAPRDTGWYASRFETVIDEEAGVARLLNADGKASLLEWGTVTTKPFATLRRAVRAAGLKMKELPKQ